MANFSSYTTKENDRWDLIAFESYGAFSLTVLNELGEEETVDAMDYIIQANPAIPVSAELEAGLVLRIPIVDFVETKSERLPPWKR